MVINLSLVKQQAAFKQNDTQESRPNNYYRFWDMKNGEQATVRFLPDLNEDNSLLFLVEKLMHTLEINGEIKSVPCLKMYQDACPICDVSSAYYKEEGKGSVNGKKYWRKKQHIIQALIIDDPLEVDAETGENSEGKIKYLNMGFQLYSVIKEAFESGEFDSHPCNYTGGCDFIIKKIEQGGRPKYDVGSKFARRSTDLTEDEIALVEDQMIDLSTLLPSHPGDEKVEAMLEAAISGGVYEDSSNFSNSSNPSNATTASDDSVISENAGQASAAPAAKAEPTEEFDDESEDILARIRNRKSAD